MNMHFYAHHSVEISSDERFSHFPDTHKSPSRCSEVQLPKYDCYTQIKLHKLENFVRRPIHLAAVAMPSMFNFSVGKPNLLIKAKKCRAHIQQNHLCVMVTAENGCATQTHSPRACMYSARNGPISDSFVFQGDGKSLP